MAKFMMMGKYSLDSLKGISAARTQKAAAIVKKAGGRINSMYVLLGAYDLALIVDFPNIQAAMKASIGLTKLTSIAFTTLPAITVEEFDRIFK